MHSALLRQFLSAAGFGTLGRVPSFFVPMFIGAWFGVSRDTDALFFSYGLIVSLANLLAIVIESSIVPFVVEERLKDVRACARFVGDTLIASSMVLCILCAVFVLFGEQIVRGVTRFDAASARLAYVLILEGVAVMFLWVASSVVAGAFNAAQRFALPAYSPTLRAVFAVAVAFGLKRQLGIHSVMLGFAAGEMLRLALLLVVGQRTGIVSFSLANPLTLAVKRYFSTAKWLGLGYCTLTFNPIIDRAMASFVGVGSVSILDYSEKAFAIPMAFLSFGVLSVLLAEWSLGIQLGRSKEVRGQVLRTAALVAGIGTIAGGLCFVWQEPLTRLAYGRGAFDVRTIPAVADTFGKYMLGFGPAAGGLVFTRYYLASKATGVLMVSAFVNTVVHVTLNFILLNAYGVSGLAISTSLTNVVVSAGFVVHFMQRHVPRARNQRVDLGTAAGGDARVGQAERHRSQGFGGKRAAGAILCASSAGASQEAQARDAGVEN
jgi:putative peptidoglycan lipid II flippase